MRRILSVLGLLALATMAVGETGYKALSVTATSQTWTFSRPQENVMLCNYGNYDAYYRLFNEFDTTAAATTSSTKLVSGSATSPNCVSFQKSRTEAGNYAAVSIICATSQTATVDVITN